MDERTTFVLKIVNLIMGILRALVDSGRLES